MRKLAAALLTILILSAIALPASAGKGGPKKPKPFKAEGHVYGIMVPPVTWYEFGLSSCPNMPATQGLTSYVVELPEFYSDGTPTVIEATSTFPLTLTELSFAFFGPACEATGTATSPAPLPAGTRFVLVHDLYSVNYDFTLTAQRTPTPSLPPAVDETGDGPPSSPEAEVGDKRVKPYKTMGHIQAPGPFSITQFEFAATCPTMPSTQGLTSQVIQIPKYLHGHSDLVVTAVGGGELPQVTDALRFQFFSADCQLLDYGQTPAALPVDAAYVDVHGYARANFDFKLTIQQLAPPRY